MKKLKSLSLVCLALASVCLTLPAFAGTQDFTLVNQTGGEIYRVFISETTNDEWQGDVLDQDTLPNGARLDVSFQGHTACLWDIMVADEEGNNVSWDAINLCEASVVVLRCDANECWAEYE